MPELPSDKKKEIIKDVYSRENTSIRQLSRVFGIGKTIVENAIKKTNETSPRLPASSVL